MTKLMGLGQPFPHLQLLKYCLPEAGFFFLHKARQSWLLNLLHSYQCPLISLVFTWAAVLIKALIAFCPWRSFDPVFSVLCPAFYISFHVPFQQASCLHFLDSSNVHLPNLSSLQPSPSHYIFKKSLQPFVFTYLCTYEKHACIHLLLFVFYLCATQM